MSNEDQVTVRLPASVFEAFCQWWNQGEGHLAGIVNEVFEDD